MGSPNWARRRFNKIIRGIEKLASRARVSSPPVHRLEKEGPCLQTDTPSEHTWSMLGADEGYACVDDLRAQAGGKLLPIEVVKLIARDVLHELQILHEEIGVPYRYLNLGNIILLPADLGTLVSQLYAEPQPYLLRPQGGLGDLLTTTFMHQVFTLSSVAGGSGMQSIADWYSLQAPEILLGLQHDTRSDIWSFGCLVYELLTGVALCKPQVHLRVPGSSQARSYLVQTIATFGALPLQLINDCPGVDQLVAMNGTIHVDSTCRSVALEENLLDKLGPVDAAATAAFLEVILKLNPEERFKARELISHSWFKI